jgi:hypothetical protein
MAAIGNAGGSATHSSSGLLRVAGPVTVLSRSILGEGRHQNPVARGPSGRRIFLSRWRRTIADRQLALCGPGNRGGMRRACGILAAPELFLRMAALVQLRAPGGRRGVVVPPWAPMLMGSWYRSPASLRRAQSLRSRGSYRVPAEPAFSRGRQRAAACPPETGAPR